MSVVTCELEGLEKVKSLFSSLGYELGASRMRGILSEAGKMLVQEAKSEIQYPGEIGRYFRLDLGVQRDRAQKDAEYVIVGPRFKTYDLRGQNVKVALVAQHFTYGFRQTDRRTRTGQSRGRVTSRFPNPVSGALIHRERLVNDGIQKGVQKQLDRFKKAHSDLVK